MDEEFPTTRWSLVLSAVERPGDGPNEALARLCEDYWFPLYAYVRRHGHPREEAQDLVQQYFARLVETRFIESAQPRAGRFRAFLLHTMKQFLLDQRRRATALKRGGGRAPIEIDAAGVEARYAASIREARTPESEYERQWALTVVDGVLDTLEADATRRGREREFRLLSPFLTEGAPRGGYRQVAAELGLSEGAVKVAVLRLRRRFGRTLRQTVAETVANGTQVDDEIRRLLGALSP